MPNYRDLINERERLISNLQVKLDRRVQAAQNSLYTKLVRIAAEIETDAVGNIKQANSISSLTGQVGRVFIAYTDNVRTSIIPWFIRSIYKLLGINHSYFKSFNRFKSNSVKSIATRRFMEHLGYSIMSNKLIKGSWLDGLSTVDAVRTSVMQRFSSAVLAGLNIKEFKRSFKDMFLSSSGLSLKSHWETHTRTIFVSLDRSMQQYYAKELNLEYYIFSGTIQHNTRDFCASRVNRVYTKDEVRKWNLLQWKGKIPNSDVFIVLGGYNCRHVLSAISEKIALRLAKSRGGVNSYAIA